MFAVPGWSLGSARPQRDTSNKSRKKKEKRSEPTVSRGENATPATKSSNTEPQDVDRCIRKDKKLKNQKSDVINDGQNGRLAPKRKADESTGDRPPKRPKASQPHKSANGKDATPSTNNRDGVNAKSPALPASQSPKLTPLQAAMQKKLLGARFRQLNESLYTSPSADAGQLFASNPTFFDEYHSGFRSQVDSWPENPVETFVNELRIRGALRQKKSDKKGERAEKVQDEASTGLPPLPRSKGKCIVADLGCGDAGLAKAVRKFSGKTGIEVRSYDLQSTHPLITKADISKLPLPESSIDVAVLCLALMGTNWIDFIEEAWRVLHWKGELWVAEIKSRFGKMERKQTATDKKKKRPGDLKKQKQAADADEAEGLIEDAGGLNAPNEKTDVTAFIGILKKRGFIMENERNVDMSNKMFVRMKFIKAIKPTKGKYKAQLPENASLAAKDKAWRSLLREDEEFDEASTLKPCLYKVR